MQRTSSAPGADAVPAPALPAAPTMSWPLTVPALLQRAEALCEGAEVAWRRPDGSIGRTTWRETFTRAKALAAGLAALGIGRGDMVATFCWNQREHLEAYCAVPALGAVLHTLNIRLHADELAYIATHARDRVVIADASLLPQLAALRERAPFEHVVVVGGEGEELPPGALRYEELLAAHARAGDDGAAPAWPVPAPPVDELEAAACCYTSGTTGMPKGVLTSHRGVFLHALASCTVDGLGVGRREVVMPVVPMFHVNAWGLPYAAAMAGAKLVLPGPRLDAQSLLELVAAEGVTLTAGVPTVFLPLLPALDAVPGGARAAVPTLRTIVIGGSAAPQGLIQAFEERHGITVLHAWGMTEMGPIGTTGRLPAQLDGAPADVRFRQQAKQGRPIHTVEVRAVGDDGEVPWDGETLGELEVRGGTIASAYMSGEGADRFTADGWFRTGDIVVVDPDGTIEIRDRAKDLIKSGGEWISSVALENALMGHPAVLEAAVVAVPDERWGERPLAAVVLRPGTAATPEELRAHLEPSFARWWLPDTFAFVDEIPRTATGKFKKTALREQFRPA